MPHRISELATQNIQNADFGPFRKRQLLSAFQRERPSSKQEIKSKSTRQKHQFQGGLFIRKKILFSIFYEFENILILNLCCSRWCDSIFTILAKEIPQNLLHMLKLQKSWTGIDNYCAIISAKNLCFSREFAQSPKSSLNLIEMTHLEKKYFSMRFFCKILHDQTLMDLKFLFLFLNGQKNRQ